MSFKSIISIMLWRGHQLLVLGIFAVPISYAGNYQNTVVGLSPTYYYELNETETEGGAIDTMGNAPAAGIFNGVYAGGGPEVGGPGPIELFGGIAVPGLGGEENLAHYSNNAGHVTLGSGALFGSNAITVSLFLKAGPAQGGDRVFTNNLSDATKSFQINVANDGLVLAVDPNQAGLLAERTLFLEDNSGPDRRLIDSDSGWFHVVASTAGTTGAERAAGFKLWINGVDRTDNLQPNITGWGIDTGLAKIGGRRSNADDPTTHSGAQDEVAIWLDRVLTDEEVETLWESAVTEKQVPLIFTSVEAVQDGEGTSVTLTWQSKTNRSYAIFSSSDMVAWNEITDNHPTGGDSTTYTQAVPAGIKRVYYKVEELPL
ncbi:MAG: hypothetical protein ACI8XO_001044 [Verrucomicrobiales bacterium]|jgi:hypothetical protein